MGGGNFLRTFASAHRVGRGAVGGGIDALAGRPTLAVAPGAHRAGGGARRSGAAANRAELERDGAFPVGDWRGGGIGGSLGAATGAEHRPEVEEGAGTTGCGGGAGA